MKNFIIGAFVLGCMGCKEKFEANIITPVTGYLVIEGVVNSGQGATTLQLTRTTQLDSRPIRYERRANVRIEGQNNNVYVLSEIQPGQYTANNLNLPVNSSYRLRINTTDGKEYLSSYEPVLVNPPIDSINFKRENDGLQLYINTNNPVVNTRYYQWEYVETWEIRSQYQSNIRYKKVTNSMGVERYSIEYRDSTTFGFDTTIYKCWQGFTSRDILIGSSAKLSSDVINLPLLFITPKSRKLSWLYSVNVRQLAWSREGYGFLEKIKKNSQSIGSIFDAQPSEIRGNIRCVSDTAEPVIGYFNITPITQLRRFRSAGDVPNWGYRAACTSVEIKNISDTIKLGGLDYIPYSVGELGMQLGSILTFFAATPSCVDCTLIGTNVKPPFWP